MRIVFRRRVLALLAALFLSFTLFNLVSAPALPSNSPVPISSYGITTLYGNTVIGGGVVNIRVSADSGGPFYVEKLLLLLNMATQVDIILDSISIDGAYTFSFNSYMAQRVTIVPSGSTIGDVVSQIPAYLSPLITKDPIGNNALFATGATNGLNVGVRFSSPMMQGNLMIMALVVAPTSATVTLTTN